MRFKKQIIIICLFTFLFLPFQREKEVEAMPLAIPITWGIKEIVTALLVASGIVITSGDTHQKMVEEVYQRQQDYINRLSSEVKNGDKVSIKEKAESIKDTIIEVYNLTYNDSYTNKNYYFDIGNEFISVPQKQFSFDSVPRYLTKPIYLNTTSEKVRLTLKIVKNDGTVFNEEAIIYPSAYNPLRIGFDGVNGLGYYMTYVPTGDVTFRTLFRNNYQNFIADVYYNVTALTGGLEVGTSIDWEEHQETNKNLDIHDGVNAITGSICADGFLSDKWEETWDTSEESYPIDKEYGSIVLTPDDVLDKPSIDDVETPTTDNTLWDTLFGFLKTLFSPITNLLSSLWDLIKGLFDMLKGLLTSILDLLKSLVKSLVDAIAVIFVPTIALEDVFNLNQNTFFGQVAEVFNFDKLWNLTPKPYEFEVDFPFYDFAEQEKRPYHLEIKFFENKFMKENINLIRNITTYPLLLISIYFVIMHFLPKRDMD